MFEKIQLNHDTFIYKGKYSGQYTKNDFLKLVKRNQELVKSLGKSNDSVPFEIESEEFHSVNNQIKKFYSKIKQRKFKNYSHNFWIYTQRKEYDVEWMHQHILVHPEGRSQIKSDFTFTFYVQTTDEISGDEGKIVFETSDKVRFSFLPKEMDIFIFPSDLRHTAIPTPNSNKERIVYAGNYCFNVMKEKPKLII